MSRGCDLGHVSPKREPVDDHEQDKRPDPSDQQQQVKRKRHEIEEKKPARALQAKEHPSSHTDLLRTLRSLRVMQLFDCGSQTNQRWVVTAGRQLQVFGSKCMDANGQGRTNGTQVIIWDCNGQANQQWNVNTNDTITGVQSGLCLDATGASTANGTKIILWACNGGANQQWTLRS